MQVFVGGTWKSEKAEPYREEGHLLGQRIAEAGLDLACGPGTGIARHVVDGYRMASPRGKVRFYLPLKSEMELVGEPVEDGADELIWTEYDYVMRNVWQIKQCCGLFVLTGGDGALEEILAAVIDYKIPVAIVENAGSAAQAMRALIEIYPDWNEFVAFGSDVEHAVQPWLDAVLSR